MCRSIKALRKYSDIASDEEIRAAARQFVRKVSGFQRPAAKNEEPFEAAVDEIAEVTARLLKAVSPVPNVIPRSAATRNLDRIARH